MLVWVSITCDSALLRWTACMLREISSGDQLYRFYRYKTLIVPLYYYYRNGLPSLLHASCSNTIVPLPLRAKNQKQFHYRISTTHGNNKNYYLESQYACARNQGDSFLPSSQLIIIFLVTITLTASETVQIFHRIRTSKVDWRGGFINQQLYSDASDLLHRIVYSNLVCQAGLQTHSSQNTWIIHTSKSHYYCNFVPRSHFPSTTVYAISPTQLCNFQFVLVAY